MRRSLQGKRVLITGASGGIGQALARQLAAKQTKLILAGRSVDKLEALVPSLGLPTNDVRIVPTDLTHDQDRENLLQKSVEYFGGIDVLINNAGIGSWAHFSDSTEEILRQIMEVNFFAPAELIRKAIPLLVDGVQPAVVNVASMCGRKAMPAWSEYSASKYALCGLTEALRGELARFEIDMLLIVPGLTNSGFNGHFLQTKGKADLKFETGMPPETVAAATVRAIERNKTETVIGSDARWMLFFNRLFPRLTDYLLARRVKRLYASA